MRGKGLCFGFVRFGDRNSENRAVECMNGKIVGEKRLLVKVATFGWSQRSGSKKLTVAEVPAHISLKPLDGLKRQIEGKGDSLRSAPGSTALWLSYLDAVKGRAFPSVTMVVVA